MSFTLYVFRTFQLLGLFSYIAQFKTGKNRWKINHKVIKCNKLHYFDEVIYIATLLIKSLTG